MTSGVSADLLQHVSGPNLALHIHKSIMLCA